MADRSERNAARTGLPHARRVGAARGDLACVAAQSRGLAGQVSDDSVALCGDRAPARGARARASACRGREGSKARAKAFWSGQRQSRPRQLSPVADRPRLDARLRPDFRRETRKGESPSPTGASMPGPSIPTGISTTRFPGRVAELLGLPQWQPTVELPTASSAGWCSKADRSTPTAQGILLTTEECLLSEVQQRNPGVSREQLEQCISRLSRHRPGDLAGRGIAGDDTHGHVDDISRFVGPATRS